MSMHRVPHGTTTTIHADVNHGQRKLAARLYVFRSESNPLIGKWHVDTRVACGDASDDENCRQFVHTFAAGQ